MQVPWWRWPKTGRWCPRGSTAWVAPCRTQSKWGHQALPLLVENTPEMLPPCQQPCQMPSLCPLEIHWIWFGDNQLPGRAVALGSFRLSSLQSPGAWNFHPLLPRGRDLQKGTLLRGSATASVPLQALGHSRWGPWAVWREQDVVSCILAYVPN